MATLPLQWYAKAAEATAKVTTASSLYAVYSVLYFPYSIFPNIFLS